MNRTSFSMIVGLVLAAVASWAAGLGFADFKPMALVPSFHLPTIVVLLAGAIIGYLVADGLKTNGQSDARLRNLLTFGPLPGTVLLAALFLLAHRLGLPGERAAVALILGVMALLSLLRCFGRIDAGDTLGFESHWGGLGGGSGGWRLFPAAGLALMAIAFAGGSLALVAIGPATEPARDTAPASGGAATAATAATAAGAQTGAAVPTGVAAAVDSATDTQADAEAAAARKAAAAGEAAAASAKGQ